MTEDCYACDRKIKPKFDLHILNSLDCWMLGRPITTDQGPNFDIIALPPIKSIPTQSFSTIQLAS